MEVYRRRARLDNNDPQNKSLFVLKSSWRLNSVHSGAESHTTVLGGSKVNPVRDFCGPLGEFMYYSCVHSFLTSVQHLASAHRCEMISAKR